MENGHGSSLQLFIRMLDGRTRTLEFASPYAYGSEIKRRIFEATKIPEHAQRLLSGGYQIADGGVVAESDATIHVLLRLRGGKGGFGSLLRGAATKAGQKKTNNFDACRDMSGRRLRHVNAEKRLEEWKAEEEERRLEKIAEDFIKKQAKKGKKGVGDGEAHKYVEKYRKDSAICVQEVDLAVKEAFERMKKRKAESVSMQDSGDGKRLKIWMGKRELVDSDDDSSEDEDESVVLDDGNQSICNESNGSLDSVTGARQDGASYSGATCGSGSDESPSSKDGLNEETGSVQVGIHKQVMDSNATSYMEEKDASSKLESEPPCISRSTCREGFDSTPADGIEDSEVGIVHDGSNCMTDCIPQDDSVKPLNFDDFESAAEMEALGMDRLKSELQAHGLKCGGTLQERAGRLFLLKSTPFEKIPRKHLAKK